MINKYLVSASFKTVRYLGTIEDGYEVEVLAKNKKEAISKARPMVRNMGWDRHEGPLIYRAVLI